MKRLFQLLFVLMLLAGAAIFAAPQFMSFGAYKQTLSDIIKVSTGFEPVIEGELEVTMFPQPLVKVSNVSIPNIEGASSGAMVSIQSLEVTPSIASLLSGKVEISSLVFQNPVFSFEKLADGRKNWESLHQKKAETGETYTIPGKAIINDATIRYVSLGKETLLENVNANVEIGSLSGPFKIEGDFDYNAQNIQLDLDIGKIEANSDLDITLSSESFSGSLKGRYDNTNKLFAGEAKTDVSDLHNFIKTVFGERSVFAAITSHDTMTLSSAFSFSASSFNLEKITIGSESLKGEAYVTGRFDKGSSWDVNVALDIVDIDKLTELDEQQKLLADAGSFSLGQSISNYRFELPKDFSGLFVLSVKNIVYKGENATDLTIDADVFNGSAIIHSLSALLPGDSRLHFAGSVLHNQVRPLLKGVLEISGIKFRSFLNWLYPSTVYVPEDQMNTFVLRSNMEVTPRKISFMKILGSVDRTLLTGSMEMRPTDKLPVIKTNLHIDSLNLDKYQITPELYKLYFSTVKTLPDVSLDSSWLQTFPYKLNSSITFDDLVFNGTNIATLITDIAVSQGKIDLQRVALSTDETSFNARFSADITMSPPNLDLVVRSQSFDTGIIWREREKSGFTSRTPINFLGLSKFNGKMDVQFGALKHKKIFLNNVKINTVLDKTVMSIKQIAADMLGGKILVKGSLGLSSTPSIAFTYAMTDVNIAKLLYWFMDEEEVDVDGTMFVKGKASFLGKTFHDWLSKGKMSAQIAGQNVIFNGINLPKVVNRVPSLFSTIDFERLMQDISTSGATKFDVIKGNVYLKDGLLQTKNIELATRNIRGVFAGNMSALSLKSNSVARIRFTPEAGKTVTMNILFEGPLNDLKRTIDTKEIENYITSKSQR